MKIIMSVHHYVLNTKNIFNIQLTISKPYQLMITPVKNISTVEIDSLDSLSKYNKLILDYFIYMGYGDLCYDFSKDLNLEFKKHPLFMRRAKIRTLIEDGEIEKAIEELDNLDINIYRIKEVFVNFTIHKVYELKHIKEEVDLIIYLRETLGELALDYEEKVAEILEYIIFNSKNIEIQDKRIELADCINFFILERFNLLDNELEKVIKGILSEENILSQKNKFVEFKERILEQ